MSTLSKSSSCPKHLSSQEEQSILDPGLPSDDPERQRLAKEIEIQNVRIHHLMGLLESTAQGIYWCRTCVRQLRRRQAMLGSCTKAANHTLAWLEEECVVLDELVDFCSKRLRSTVDVVEQEFFRKWLADQVERAGKQRIAIDQEQEFVIEAEINRLQVSAAHASRMTETLGELHGAHMMEGTFDAERCGAELAVVRSEENTDERTKWVERLTRLKDKVESIREQVQGSLQKTLESTISDEDNEMDMVVTFTGDVADCPLHQLADISATLKHPPHHPQHLKMEAWIKIYRKQPWLAAQTQAEQRAKADRAARMMELEEMRVVVSMAKKQMSMAEKELEDHRKMIKGYEDRLAGRGDMPQEGDEPLSENERQRTEVSLRKAKDKEEDLVGMLERRQSANKRKEEELMKLDAAMEEEIRAEEERHSRQAAAMAMFKATERDDNELSYDKHTATATVERMKSRLEKMKAIQLLAFSVAPLLSTATKYVEVGKRIYKTDHFQNTTSPFDRDVEEQDEQDYTAHADAIAKKAKLAAVERQIADLSKAKAKIAVDFTSADAQMMIAQQAEAEAEVEDGEEAKRLEALREKIKQRKDRLKEAKMIEEREKEEEKQAEIKRRQEAALQKRGEQIADKTAEELGLGGKLKSGDNIVSKMARVKDRVQAKETYGGGFVDHSTAVEAAIRSRHKAKLGKIEAITKFCFTVGKKETEAFNSSQARLASQGLPHFQMIKKGLGGRDVAFLWVMRSLDSSEFITDIQLSHANPDDPLYRNLKPHGYMKYGHDSLASKGRGQPSILIWAKRDPHEDGIFNIDLSFNSAEEKKLADQGFKRVPGRLSDLGLPDMLMWYSTVKRGADTLPPVKAILHDLQQVREMRKQNKDDPALITAEEKLEAKLTQARVLEEQRAQDKENPLKYAIETYALTASDINSLIEHFAEMDSERTGSIDAETFFYHLSWPRNAFADHLFAFMESEDEDGKVDFGDFVKLVCSYSLFGKSDLLRYAYTVYDGGKGYVSFDDLMSLLNDIHKTNAGPIERALREADISRMQQLSYKDFLQLDKRFPKMFYPVANLQREIRKRFLGETYWTRKMNLFEETRARIVKESEGAGKRLRQKKLREEEINSVKTRARKAAGFARKGAIELASRTKDKLEKSKWLSKLMS
ncbi:unnamed protein product [Discosporangium mesarthrocarpum]